MKEANFGTPQTPYLPYDKSHPLIMLDGWASVHAEISRNMFPEGKSLHEAEGEAIHPCIRHDTMEWNH